MPDIVKRGPTIAVPSSALEGPCWRCGASDSEIKNVDLLVMQWECGHHNKDDASAAAARLAALIEAALTDGNDDPQPRALRPARGGGAQT